MLAFSQLDRTPTNSFSTQQGGVDPNKPNATAQASSDFDGTSIATGLQWKARCAELELLLAQKTQESEELRRLNQSLASHVQELQARQKNAATSSQSSTAPTARTATKGNETSTSMLASPIPATMHSLSSPFKQTQQQQFEDGSSVLTLQRELLSKQERIYNLEQQVERTETALQSLQSSITREVQNAKDEAESQVTILRSQLYEEKEKALTLQEKLLTATALSQGVLSNDQMLDTVTERVLITSDAVLHRLRTEYHSSLFKTQQDVKVSVEHQTLVLTGKKIHVQLLKSEIMSILAQMYSQLLDPAKYNTAWKGKQDALKVEVEQLQRLVAVHEATIESLHSALKQTQTRAADVVQTSNEASNRAEVIRRDCEEKTHLLALKEKNLERENQTLRAEVNETKETCRLALDSLKAELHVSQQLRLETARMRGEFNGLHVKLQEMDRTNYVSAEQNRTLRAELAKLQDQLTQSAGVKTFESEMKSFQECMVQNQRDAEGRITALSSEKGAFKEKCESLEARNQFLESKMMELRTERDTLLGEVSAGKELLHDAKEKARFAAVTSNFVMKEPMMMTTPGGRSPTAPTAPPSLPWSPSAGGGLMMENGHSTGADALVLRIHKLEEDNANLRQELQSTYDDLKVITTNLRETRTIREQTLVDMERLEMEKNKLQEERQLMERSHLQERLKHRQREAELEAKVLNLTEEAQHAKKRVENLHKEYQRRIDQYIDHMNVEEEAAGEGPEGTTPTNPATSTQEEQLEEEETVVTSVPSHLLPPPPSGGDTQPHHHHRHHYRDVGHLVVSASKPTTNRSGPPSSSSQEEGYHNHHHHPHHRHNHFNAAEEEEERGQGRDQPLTQHHHKKGSMDHHHHHQQSLATDGPRHRGSTPTPSSASHNTHNNHQQSSRGIRRTSSNGPRKGERSLTTNGSHAAAVGAQGQGTLRGKEREDGGAPHSLSGSEDSLPFRRAFQRMDDTLTAAKKRSLVQPMRLKSPQQQQQPISRSGSGKAYSLSYGNGFAQLKD